LPIRAAWVHHVATEDAEKEVGERLDDVGIADLDRDVIDANVEVSTRELRQVGCRLMELGATASISRSGLPTKSKLASAEDCLR
jgi:hypothetical protein